MEPTHEKDYDKLERVRKQPAHWAYCHWDRHTYTWSRTYEEACKHLKLTNVGKQKNDFIIVPSL